MQNRDGLLPEHSTTSSEDAPTEPHPALHYRPELRPSKELIERSQRMRSKEEFYDKSHGLYGFVTYEEGETLPTTGCDFHLMPYLPPLLDVLEDEKYENSYIFFQNPPQLYYVMKGQLEKVKIDHLKEFKKAVGEIMDDEKRKYTLKYLTAEQIYHLITLNGGHVPQKNQEKIIETLPKSVKKESKLKKLMHDLFPRKQVEETKVNPLYPQLKRLSNS